MIPQLLCIGSYTAATGGGGAGISVFRREASSGRLDHVAQAVIPSPSFVIADPKRALIHAVNEIDAGTVTTLRLDADDSAVVMNVVGTGGSGPCHCALTHDGRFVVCTNYADGTVGVVAVDSSGVVASLADVAQRSGSGPDPDRQRSSHPHMALMVGPDEMLVADLGTDELAVYSVAASGRISLRRTIEVSPGSGPRHVAAINDSSSRRRLVAVSGELDASVSLIDLDTPSRPVTMRSSATGDAGQAVPSHIAHDLQSGDIFVANRGANVLTSIGIEGRQPTARRDIPVGANPRHFDVIGNDVYVAAQDADQINVIRLPFRGVPVLTSSIAAHVVSPTCVTAVEGFK